MRYTGDQRSPIQNKKLIAARRYLNSSFLTPHSSFLIQIKRLSQSYTTVIGRHKAVDKHSKPHFFKAALHHFKQKLVLKNSPAQGTDLYACSLAYYSARLHRHIRKK